MIKNFTTTSLLALLISVSVIVGCSDDDNVALNTCFITKVAFGGPNQFVFNYTADNKLSNVAVTTNDSGATKTETSTVSYDSKGNIVKIGDATSYSSYSYNDNNQVINDEYYEGTKLNDRTEYEYNATGQLVKTQFYSVNSTTGNTMKSSYQVYTYSSSNSKNPVTQKEYSNSGGILYASEEYEFDDKKTWYNSISKSIILSEVGEAQNNLLKKVSKDEDGTIQSTTTYVYEYNDKGYPIKMTATEVAVNATNPDVFVQIYTYDCK